jgi:hypothetical protein
MTADSQDCKTVLFTICEATFPFIHKIRATCASALYFGQPDLAHKLYRKVILDENFYPVWLQAKRLRPFWIYSLPSPVLVTKKRKLNGTTHNVNIRLSNTGILNEDTNCQFYSEAFVLLPVSDGYTNVSLTSGQVLLPHLPELISPEEHNQITHGEAWTQRTLSALEAVARRSSTVNQQSYVELRDLLESMSSDGAMTNHTTFLYALSTFSIILPLVVLTSKYWQRPLLMIFRRFLPSRTEQRPCLVQVRSRPATLGSATTDIAMTVCPCYVEIPDENVGVATSYPATPLQMETETTSRPAPAVQPKTAERVQFAQPGKFQIRK